MEKEYHLLMSSINFWLELGEWDEEEGRKCQELGCPDCDGVLDRAYYERRPRGVLLGVPLIMRRRVSFCCRECRHRVTPESLRFARCKVFSLPTILMSLVLVSSKDPVRTARRVSALCLMSEVTLRRWRGWIDRFSKTPAWKLLRSRLSPRYDESCFPNSLFLEFQKAAFPFASTVVATVRYLAVLSVVLVT